MPYNLRSKSRSTGTHGISSSTNRIRSRSSELRRTSHRASKSLKSTHGHRRNTRPSSIQTSSPRYDFRSRTSSSSSGSLTRLIWSPPLGLLGFPSAHRREIRRLCRLCNDNVLEPHRHEVPVEQGFSSPSLRRHSPRPHHGYESPIGSVLSPRSPRQPRRSLHHHHEHEEPIDRVTSPRSPQQLLRRSPRHHQPPISPPHTSPFRPPMDPGLERWLEQRKKDKEEKRRAKQAAKRVRIREMRESRENRTVPYLEEMPPRQRRLKNPPIRSTARLVEADRRVMSGRVRRPEPQHPPKANPSHALYPSEYESGRYPPGVVPGPPHMLGPHYIPPPQPPYAVVTQYSRVPLVYPPRNHGQAAPHPPRLHHVGRHPQQQQQHRQGFPPPPNQANNGEDWSDIDGHYEVDDAPPAPVPTNVEAVPEDFQMSDAEFQDLLRAMIPSPSSQNANVPTARPPRTPRASIAPRSPIPDFDFSNLGDLDFSVMNELPDLANLGLPDLPIDPAILREESGQSHASAGEVDIGDTIVVGEGREMTEDTRTGTELDDLF